MIQKLLSSVKERPKKYVMNEIHLTVFAGEYVVSIKLRPSEFFLLVPYRREKGFIILLRSPYTF
jgi:hypothetical protein